MNRFMLSGFSSGSGKTVLTMGILRALQNKGLDVHSYKCGPDYIDPMFHKRVLGIPCRNLDPYLMGTETVCMEVMNGNDKSDEAQIAVIEGVMGFYDGIAGTTDNSAYTIARMTDTPVILIISPSGQSITLSAMIRGIQDYEPDSNIAGVILNRCKPSMYMHLKDIIERNNGIKVFGYLPELTDMSIDSRHLGLIMADEVPDFDRKLKNLVREIEDKIDLDEIISMANSWQMRNSVSHSVVSGSSYKNINNNTISKSKGDIKIAVARDEAFCFYYDKSFENLTEKGIELVYFSPVHDDHIPDDVQGLYLGGGYPELYASELEVNASIRHDIKNAIEDGMPVIAECGGFLYLGQELEDSDGHTHKMVGVLPGRGFKTDKLVRFGYSEMTSDTDSLIFDKGDKIPCHEFHYWDSTDNGECLVVQKAGRNRSWKCGFTTKSMYAAFPHIVITSAIADRIYTQMIEYKNKSK